jgi:hypothetical protein
MLVTVQDFARRSGVSSWETLLHILMSFLLESLRELQYVPMATYEENVMGHIALFSES